VSTVSIAVPVPFLDLLTYRVPEHIELPTIGARVRVPVGTRTLTGCVVEHSTNGAPVEGLKDIVEVLDREPFLPPHVVELCRWVADYYVAGIGDAIAAAMPPGARARATSFRTRRVASLTAHGLSVLGDADGARLSEKQRAAIEALRDVSAALPLADLKERGIAADVIGRLVTRGLVTVRAETDERDPFERAALTGVVPDASRQLTTEQTDALSQLGALADTGGFRVALLHGVTGSGKTEIYARLADRMRQRGRQTLLMVPEIALTPSVAALFRQRFGDRVAIQHSALSDGERHDQWHRIRRGDVDVVVGTRSAVFVPLSRLGLIVVDEEHDTSYKQEEAPRYHGRDVAIVRAQREQALVVLGSATPSMETYQNAETGKYTRATLARRVLDRPLAAVRVVNMRQEYADEGPTSSSAASFRPRSKIDWRDANRSWCCSIAAGTRRRCSAGNAATRSSVPTAPISLTVHTARNGWRARCHYCNYSTMVPKQCRKCAAPYLEHAGFGTEKVEQQLRDRFPDARIGRVDRDSVRRKGALTSVLSRFAAGELDVLVGTQMIAKGHDFPRVTLVGVISADVGLGLADFRAAERTFQLLTQVAGRAGRGERVGEAIVQTLYPDHYSIQLACRQDYAAFFERELTYRRAMRYPPLVALVNAVVRGRTFEDAMQTASDLVRRLEPLSTVSGFSILGPGARAARAIARRASRAVLPERRAPR
jgi:primosomal protein N' (replication factor Y)